MPGPTPRLRRRTRNDTGGTLVETMVALTLVGGLTGIAAPTLAPQIDRAHEAAVLADLRHYTTYQTGYGIEHGRYGSIPQIERWAGARTLSPGNTAQTVAGTDTFCLTVTHAASGLSRSWRSGEGLLPAGGACPTPST